MKRRHLSAALLFPVTQVALAVEGARPAFTPPPAANSTGSMAQIIFSLLLVLAVIILVARLLKRMNLVQAGTGNLLKVVGGVAIGQRERIVLVEAGDTWLVVGVGPGQIRTLHTLPKQETSNAGSVAANTPGAQVKFANLLSSVMQGRSSGTKHHAP
jgi:flagellar protein FliO/FliZ